MKKIILALVAVISISALADESNGQFTLEITKISTSGTESVAKCYTAYNLSDDQEIAGEGSLNQKLADISTELRFHQVEAGALYFTHLIDGKQASQIILTDESTISVGPFGNSYHVTVRKPKAVPVDMPICK